MKRHVTKEGIEVWPGQCWRDLDHRMGDRKRYVIAIDDEKGKAQMADSMTSRHTTWVSIRRMHKHSTGWALVSDVPR